jgi:hypothetical protein
MVIKLSQQTEARPNGHQISQQTEVQPNGHQICQLSANIDNAKWSSNSSTESRSEAKWSSNV